MSWPTTGVGSLATGYIAAGVTTIRWGSKEILQKVGVTNTNYLIVTRASQRADSERIKLPNGDGPTVTDVQIVDGVQWDLTVRDDTRLATTLPQIGASVTVIDMAGLIDTVGEVYAARIIESGYDAAPKQAGERTLTVSNLVLVDSQTGGAQA